MSEPSLLDFVYIRASMPMPEGKPKPSTTIAWIFIGLMLILIAAWTVWAAHKANIPSLWAPD
jgi:hypothetical protein